MVQAGGLHHDGDGALFSVPARYGDGDTLALLIQTEDDELTRLRMLCDKRSFEFSNRQIVFASFRKRLVTTLYICPPLYIKIFW